MDVTQDFVQNFANLGENRQAALRDLINSMTDDNVLRNLQELIMERRVAIARERGEQGSQNPVVDELEQRYQALVQSEANEVNPMDPSTAVVSEDVSDNTNVEPTSAGQPSLLDVSVEVDPQDPTTAVAPENPPDNTTLYQETFPQQQAFQLDESVEMGDDEVGDGGWRELPRAFSMESEGDRGQVINVLGDVEPAGPPLSGYYSSALPPGALSDSVDPMEPGDNRPYYGQLPKKPKRTKRKKKKKKPYEDLIITQKKHLKKLQKMSEKLSKKMSKTKKKKRKKKVSDSY